MTRTLFRNLTISNAFIFSAVMADEEICRRVIELALGIPIAKVHICVEKTMVYHPEYHGIRLDVYAADEKNTRFNIEMQVAFQRYLPKRSRYYHSQLDMDALSAGASYEKLPDTYVIFICDFDPFGKGLYRYTCETKCCEDGFSVADGVKTVYLNARGKNPGEVPEELVEFLKYVHATREESEADFQDPFVKRLQEKVRKIKNNRSMEERYMLLEEMMRKEPEAGLRKGHKEGLKEGHREGLKEGILAGRKEEKAQSILAVLSTKGVITPELRARIEGEGEMDKLSQWLLLAASVSTPEEFAQRM